MISKDPWLRFLDTVQSRVDNAPQLSKTRFTKTITRAIRAAVKQHHRRLFVLTGTDTLTCAKHAVKIIEHMFKVCNIRDRIDVLYVGFEPKEPPEIIHASIIEHGLKSYPVRLQKLPFAASTVAMGRTYDVVIIDFNRDMPPNDIGRLVETAKGGGLVILLAPPIEKWANLRTAFHRYITTIPWTLDDVRGLFIKRFIKKLLEHDGIYIFDFDRNVIVKHSEEPERPKKFERKRLSVPKDAKLSKKIYELAITEDQIKVLKTLERLLEPVRRDTNVSVIITADRGRGKSAAVGLFLGALAKMYAGKGAFGRFMILVTAPYEYNVYTLFEFAEKALRTLGENPKVTKNPLEIRGRGYIITYALPAEATKIAKREKAEVIAVDEAAGVPVPILFKLLRSAPRVVYSSTIHGYEGAGRGFSIRFLKRLQEEENLKFFHVTMEEPVRYAPDDPIEKWLFDTLLLDAEPVKLDESDLEDIARLNVKLERVNLPEWFIGEKENDLRQFIGIYVFAHYRNEPKDLAIMADAPHYEAYALRLPSGKIVTALLVAIEGGLPRNVIQAIYKDKSAEPSGHLIPVAIEKHYRDTSFPKLVGYRIVRIATHPNVMSRGLGSKAIEELIKVAKERGFAWIGAGFGANERLVHFWLKNKFVPIHVSPMRHKVSGEYTTIVIRPLRKELERVIREYYREFRIRFVEWLRYVHYDMEPRLALLLLKGGYIWERIEKPFRYEPRLTDIQRKRIAAYHMGILSYELASDAIQEIIKAYFIDEDPTKPELDEMTELVLLCRVLQARTWSQTIDLLDEDLTRKRATRLFGKAIITLYRYFVKEREREEEAERFGVKELAVRKEWAEAVTSDKEEDYERLV